jgi:hypothetical protein
VITRVLEKLLRLDDPVLRFASRYPDRARRLVVLEATGITLALVRRMHVLCWSAVGIVFVAMRSANRSAAPAALAISSARP